MTCDLYDSNININNNIMYFAEEPITSTIVNSLGNGTTPADAALNGCSSLDPTNPTTLSVGTASTFDLTTLGFTPPFKAK